MNKEKLKSSIEFPNIFRFITEQKYFKRIKKHQWRLITAGFVSAIILGAIVIVGADSYKNYQENKRLSEKRENIETQIKFWKSINQKYPGFRDSYFELAILEYQLKDFSKSREYLKEVLRLDPNFKSGRRLGSILNEK
ncbi:MAG: tetratricopeptide repeat protein [Patescibacteria group bacterium]